MNPANATAIEVEGGGKGAIFEVRKTYAVKLTTGIEFKGIVLAYDSVPNIVIFQDGAVPETGDSMTTRMVNANFISKLRYIGKVVDPLASKTRSVDLYGLARKEAIAIRQIERIGVGVTEEAQSIFDALSKMFYVQWENKDIVVMREVRVCSPYHHSDCVNGGTNAARNRVKIALKQVREKLQLSGT